MTDDQQPTEPLEPTEPVRLVRLIGSISADGDVFERYEVARILRIPEALLADGSAKS